LSQSQQSAITQSGVVTLTLLSSLNNMFCEYRPHSFGLGLRGELAREVTIDATDLDTTAWYFRSFDQIAWRSL
jgi:hypothetical protein